MHAESLGRLILPDGVHKAGQSAIASRKAHLKALSPANISSSHLPQLVCDLKAHITRHARHNDPQEFLWHPVAEHVAFTTACRTALGEVMTPDDVAYMLPLHRDLTGAQFALVR